MSHQGAYGYAVARIRAMGHRLLGAPVVQRMVDAEDPEAVIKILNETSYFLTISANPQEKNFDKILEKDLLSVYEEIRSFTPDKELVDIMRLSYDFHNVNVILKSAYSVKHGGKKRWDLLTSLGSYPVDDLLTYIESEEYTLLPFGLNTTVPQCIAARDQTKNVLEMERMLDKRLYEVMREISDKLGFDLLDEWIRDRIDGENLRSLVRLKRFGFDSAKALPFLHEGGNAAPDMMAKLIAEPFESWSRALSFTDLSKVLERLDTSDDFSAFILALEKELDDYYLEKIAESFYSSTAPENIPGYLWAKELEVKNIRVILVSKANKGDKDRLRRLLRNVSF